MRTWLLPMAGFIGVALLALMLSASNLDNRAEIQMVGLVACAVIGADALRRGPVQLRNRISAHAVAALGLGIGILAFVIFSSVFAARAASRAKIAARASNPRSFDFHPRDPIDVWIDTDPSCGLRPNADVDDCWALLAALRSPQMRVIGISSVFGNAGGESTYAKAREVVRIAGSNVSVWRGALRNGLEPTDASRALAAALERRTLTILAIGPLTNIATVLVHRPDLRDRIVRIVFVGGRHPGQLFHPGKHWWFHFRDLNVCGDPDAAEKVLYSRIPITLIPFELAEKVTIGERELEHLELGDAAARWLSAVSRPWARYWKASLGRAGFYPFDFLAVSYLTTPTAFGCDVAPARVGFSAFLQPIGAGRDLEVAPRIRGPLVRYCTAVDRARLSLTPAPRSCTDPPGLNPRLSERR